MKKTFSLSHPKKTPARVVDAIKHDIKKYMKRERNKALPKGMDFWDFDCQFGDTEALAEPIHYKEINKCIDGAVEKGLDSFYVEVLARAEEKPFVEKSEDGDFGE